MSRPLPTRALPPRAGPSVPTIAVEQTSIGPQPAPKGSGGQASREPQLQQQEQKKELSHAPSTPTGMRRAAIVAEIVSSERVYCTHLLRLYCLYCQPLTCASAGSGRGQGQGPGQGQQGADAVGEMAEWEALLGVPLDTLSSSVASVRSAGQLQGRGPMLSSEEGDSLWPGFAGILQLHRTLLGALQREVAPFQGGSEGPGLGSLAAASAVAGVLSKHAPYMKLLAPYCSGHARAVLCLARWRAERPELDAWIRAMEGERGGGSAGQSLDSLLVMPVQRVPRYILLLQELAKACASSAGTVHGENATTEPVVEQVSRALTLVQQSASALNTSIAVSEGQRGVLQWQGRLTPPPEPTLVSPGRTLLRQGMVQKLCKPGRRWKLYAAALFSEGPLLVYAQGSLAAATGVTAANNGSTGAGSGGSAQGTEPLKVHGILTVVGVEAVPAGGSGGDAGGMQMKVLARPKSVVLRCQDEEEAQGWMHALQQALIPPARARLSISMQRDALSHTSGHALAAAAGSTAASTATGTPRAPLPAGSTHTTTTATSARPPVASMSASERGSTEGREAGPAGTSPGQRSGEQQRQGGWGHGQGQRISPGLPSAASTTFAGTPVPAPTCSPIVPAPAAGQPQGGPGGSVDAGMQPRTQLLSSHWQKQPALGHGTQHAVTVSDLSMESSITAAPLGQKASFFKANQAGHVPGPADNPTVPEWKRVAEDKHSMHRSVQSSLHPPTNAVLLAATGCPPPARQVPQQATMQLASEAAARAGPRPAYSRALGHSAGDPLSSGPAYSMRVQAPLGLQPRPHVPAAPHNSATPSSSGARQGGMQGLAQRWGNTAAVHAVSSHAASSTGTGRLPVPLPVTCDTGRLASHATTTWAQREDPEQAAAALRAMIAAEGTGNGLQSMRPRDATAAMLMQRQAAQPSARRTMVGMQPHSDPFAELDPFRR